MAMTVEIKFGCIRMSAQKLRMVVNGLRGSKLGWACQFLALYNQKSTELIRKTMRCAVGILMRHGVLLTRAKLENIRIDKATSSRTPRARAKGRINFVERQTSHMIITLEIQQHGKES